MDNFSNNSNSSAQILIVDDQVGGREVLRGLLTGQGYELAFANSGEEALAKAATLFPDLILLDVMMPGMDGFEVSEHVRNDPQMAEVPIIMITALDDNDSVVRGIEAGADDFVTKPFNLVELRARVRTIIRLNRYRRLLLERSHRQQAEAETYRRNYELTLLNNALNSTASTLDVHDILHVACETLSQAFELPQATALLLSEDRSKYSVEVEYRVPDFHPADLNEVRSQMSSMESPAETIPLVAHLSEVLMSTKVPVAIAVGQDDPQLAAVQDCMREFGLRSLLVVPIFIGDQFEGVIELVSTQYLELGQQDLTLAQSVATAIGQALGIAQLYQSLQAHANSLEETVAQRTCELQNERDRTRSILEALGEAVIVTDVGGTIQYLNPATMVQTGFSEEEAIGSSWRLWQSRKARKGRQTDLDGVLYDEIMDVVSTGQTWTGEVVNTRKDNTVYDSLLTVAPLVTPNSVSQTTIGFVTVQRDITLLKGAERLRMIHQNRENQAALDRLRHTFLSTVNHEMRTPIAVIYQILEMLEQSHLGGLNEKQLDAVQSMRQQTQTLGQMVEGLTRVAAYLSKQKEVRPVPASLEPVFNAILPLTEFKARSKEITVETKIAPMLPSCPLDVNQIEEALTQLIDNAIKFNHRSGSIQIEAQSNSDWVTISVADTGVGIADEHLNSIWDMFEQGVDPLRRAQEGLGLGLVLARYIVEAHQGKIEVETKLGQGSTFTVKLPRKSSFHFAEAT